ncbi:MAG TPA: hypothetical protein DEB43_07560 [Desulfovibrio sp.]|nr:hypothetical protein [Desulfovibrio sp.]
MRREVIRLPFLIYLFFMFANFRNEHQDIHKQLTYVFLSSSIRNTCLLFISLCRFLKLMNKHNNCRITLVLAKPVNKIFGT